ncbi:MAG: polyketide cyclase [Alphaproteobacteria bacterium]|nr:polyketide cyclase [Alphaproteobacteria bacterium]
MFKKIGIAVVVLIAAVLIYAATKPDTFRVERTASIKAPPEKIHPLLNSFKQHTAWSPWEKKDPAMKRAYSGAESGKGSVYEWDGNSDIGKGRIEITETTPSKVAMKLDFLEPFEAHNMAEFTLSPKGETTDVTWAIFGPMPYISKVMTIFCNMDTMIGKEFEAGLADLKALAEK